MQETMPFEVTVTVKRGVYFTLFVWEQMLGCLKNINYTEIVKIEVTSSK